MPPPSAEVVEQQATCYGLALAILAAACRLPDFAGGADLRELLPVLLEVVQYGGVSRILGQGGVWAGDAGADAAIVSDALECLVGSAAAGGPEAVVLLRRCNAVQALAKWLTAAAATLTSVPYPSGTDGAAATATGAEEAQTHNGVLLAAALLERMLAGGGASTAAVLAEHPSATAQIVAALAELVGNPRLLLPANTTAQQPQSQPPPQRPQQQRGSTPDDAAAAPPKDGGAGGGGGGGAAQLQLEALHLLLMLLQLCREQPGAAAVERELVRMDEQVAWSEAVRRGQGWVLRSRAPAALKHAALQLAECVVEVVGHAWLLGPRGAATASASAASVCGGRGGGSGAPRAAPAEEPGTFMMVLAETLKIETGLLLQDALNPDRQVPDLSSHRSAARGHDAPPAPSQRLLDELAARAAQHQAAEEAAVRAAVDAAGGGGGTAAGTGPSLTEGPAEAGLSAQPSLTTANMDVDAGSAGAGSADAAAAAPRPPSLPPPSTVPAGQRALALLPACFQLMEACVQALAADADAGAEEDASAEDSMFMDQDEERGQTAEGAVKPQPVPLLSDAVAQKLMGTFDGIIETVLQFFESAHEYHQQQQLELQEQQQQLSDVASSAATATSAPSTGAAVPPGALLMGAARVLSCYLAEIPVAVRHPKILRTLPTVMALRSDGWAAGGAAVEASTAGLHQPLSVAGDESALVDGEYLNNFALTYLMPGLLQATSPGADGRSQVAQALRGSRHAVDACVTYMAACVQCCAAGQATRGAERSEGSERPEGSLGAVSSLLLNLLEPSALGALVVAAADAAAGLATEEAGAEGPGAAAGAGLPSSLPASAWEVLRRCFVAGTAGAAAGAPGDNTAVPTEYEQAVAAAAAAGTQQLPSLLAQLAPVCWLARRWVQLRQPVLQALASADPLRPHTAGSGGSAGGSAVGLLLASGLRPSVLLSVSCLAAVVASTTLSYLATAAAAAGAQRAAALRAAAAALLPPAVLEAVGGAALAAAGACAAMKLSELRDATTSPSRDAAKSSDPRDVDADVEANGDGLVKTEDLLDEILGEGSECWERLLTACAQLVEASEVVWRLAVAAAPGDGCGGAIWLRHLAAARDAGEPAAAELLLSEVHLALLLQMLG